MQFNIDSWPWKFAVVGALLFMREFIRLVSPKEKGEHNETSKWLIETVDSAAIAIGLVLFVIQPFILQAFYIPSGSMENTLMGPPVPNGPGGDRLLVSKMVYRLHAPRFQDVVVFKAPPAANNPPDTDFIKRCIGTPGDVIQVINRQLYRNGQPIPEIYTKWVNDTPAPRISYDMKIVGDAVYSRDYDAGGQVGQWTQNGASAADDDQATITAAKPGAVPEGHFLMLGDHRSNSNDGHVWGFVPKENIVGKAICVFWPPTRLGLVDRMSSHPRKP